jgi:TDG/mug DNA glycosylase family protein
MKTEQVNLRLEAELLAALERVAQAESLDRATVIRRLLESSIRRWDLERALTSYRRGDLSLGRAAEETGLTQWELLEVVRTAGIAYPLDADEARERLVRLAPHEEATLPDIPPSAGGVLLVGINPAPISVAAGHYYQGRLGRRLWRRLESVGLLSAPVPGAEDEAFARAGHGLTDLVKRPTASSAELSESELREGVEVLRANVREWHPGLVLFAFVEPARRLLGRGVAPGAGPEFEGVRTFLLSGPYAPAAETDRIDGELRQLLGAPRAEDASLTVRTQRITPTDIERGQIRLPRAAKRFFPRERTIVDVVLRGARISAAYDPRTGPDRERSAVLRVGASELRDRVRPDEILHVSRGLGGVVLVD